GGRDLDAMLAESRGDREGGGGEGVVLVGGVGSAAAEQERRGGDAEHRALVQPSSPHVDPSGRAGAARRRRLTERALQLSQSPLEALPGLRLRVLVLLTVEVAQGRAVGRPRVTHAPFELFAGGPLVYGQ